MSVGAFREINGKLSISRVLATVGFLSLVLMMFLAALAGKWAEAATFGGIVGGQVTLMYGANKVATAVNPGIGGGS